MNEEFIRLRLSLVSLVSVSARNWCQLCETVERAKKGEIVEIANIHAGSMHVAEKMARIANRPA
jgi:hypothetical protein